MPPDHAGTAATMALHDKARLRAAARHALAIYPGPVGELLARELNAYADFGRGLAGDALIPRLAAEILATPGCAAEGTAAPLAGAIRFPGRTRPA